MIKNNHTENIITEDNVLPGDILLFWFNTKPTFIDFNKQNVWINFSVLIAVLIDRLIIATSNSMCTHSAIATESKIVLSFMPCDLFSEANIPIIGVIHNE